MEENTTNIFYKGDVSVKIKINGKMYDICKPNEGLPYLLYAIAVFLTGNYTLDMTIVPEYIDLRRHSSGGSEMITYLKYRSPISGKKYYADDMGCWVAEFSATLSSEQLLDLITVDDPATYYLYMMSGYDQSNTQERYHDLARLEIEKRVLAQLTPGVTSTIVWKMKILNHTGA